MCKFHQDIALDVATRADGSIDPTVYALNIIALGAHYSIKHYMPEMKGVKGSMTYKLASQDSQAAFKNSGLIYDPQAFTAYRSETLPLLQEASQQTIKKYEFDQKRPSVIKNRIKSFLQVAPDELYKPFDYLEPDVFQTHKQAEQYQVLRLAAADYWNSEGVKDTLHERFKHSVSALFSEAPNKTPPLLLKIYEAIPDRLKKFSDCAGGICASAGGTVVGHLGCLAKVALLPTLGAASGMSHNPALMYSLMGGGTALGLGAWQFMHYLRGTLPRKRENIMTYGAACASLTVFMALHTFSNDHASHHQHAENEQPSITYFHDQQGRYFMVQKNTVCGVRRVKDTVINGVSRDTLMPFTLMRSDTIKLRDPLSFQEAQLTP